MTTTQIRKGLPCSVGTKTDTTILLLNVGSKQINNDEKAPISFIDHLRSGGDNWMWEDIRNISEDIAWVITSLERGTGIWVTDGSYMPNVREDMCSAAWIFLCCNTGHKLSGSFYEESQQADSYRG